MKRLTVLYDEKCGLCEDLKNWASRQPAYVELRFVPAGSQEAFRLYPQLVTPGGRPSEMIVVGDDGGVYRDAQAYIMCFYALENYREWALRLSTPTLMPLARQAFRFLSRNRRQISDWFGLEGETRLARKLKMEMPPLCEFNKPTSGIQCPYCRAKVRPGDGVFCPECGAIHHRDCWITNGYRCSIFGCTPEKRVML
jgi:predicted DCC family thiol-disulfide oxidoreductase YuxK